MPYKDPERTRAYNKAYRAANLEKLWEKRREKYRADPDRKQKRRERYETYRERARALNLKLRYGLSLEEYERMIASQSGRCAICDRPMVLGLRRRHDKKGQSVSVDHCHRTKAIRGLIHSSCNTSLGGFSDDPEIVYKAYLYLKRHEDSNQCANDNSPQFPSSQSSGERWQ